MSGAAFIAEEPPGGYPESRPNYDWDNHARHGNPLEYLEESSFDDDDWEDIDDLPPPRLFDETGAVQKSGWDVSIRRAETIKVLTYLDPLMECSIKAGKVKYLVNGPLFGFHSPRTWLCEEEALEFVRVYHDLQEVRGDYVCDPVCGDVSPHITLPEGDSNIPVGGLLPNDWEDILVNRVRPETLVSGECDYITLSPELLRTCLKEKGPAVSTAALGIWFPKNPRTLGGLRKTMVFRDRCEKSQRLLRRKYKSYLILRESFTKGATSKSRGALLTAVGRYVEQKSTWRWKESIYLARMLHSSRPGALASAYEKISYSHRTIRPGTDPSWKGLLDAERHVMEQVFLLHNTLTVVY